MPHPVQGHCPACGEEMLQLIDRMIVCSQEKCPQPSAVNMILVEASPDHIVSWGEYAFNIKHPIIERINDDLFDCELHTYLKGLDGPPGPPGQYRARLIDDSWSFSDL